MKIQTRTVHVGNISDLAGEREIREFFSFSGEIEHVEIRSGEVGALRTAFVTFKDPKALEIALLLSGATIVDQLVSITAIENYAPKVEEQAINGQATNVTLLGDDVPTIEAGSSRGSGHIYVSKAQEVVTSMLARGSAIRQDAVSKAKEFDEKHRLSANTSAKVISFDKRVGLSEKITVGISVVNEKVKSVDQRLHVSDKTMAALFVAERKLIDTGTTVKTNRDTSPFPEIDKQIAGIDAPTIYVLRSHRRLVSALQNYPGYVTAGTAWLNGAFGRVAKVSHVAGVKTKEKFQLAVSNLTAKESVVAAA